jgi:hypothetical protein
MALQRILLRLFKLYRRASHAQRGTGFFRVGDFFMTVRRRFIRTP